MTDQTKTHDDKRKRFGPGCFVAFLLLLIVYVLSPPIVVWMFGMVCLPGPFWMSGSPLLIGSPAFDIVYYPLFLLSDHLRPVNDFYHWYFDLFPLIRLV